MADSKGNNDLEFIDVRQSEAASASGSAPLMDSYDTSNGGRTGIVDLVHQSSHPTATLFHYLFKTLALIFYILSGFVSINYIFVFVVCILLLAFDFWTVKNITGRLMVGLRWWNQVKDDGSTEWFFESLDNPNEVNPIDSKLFWSGLYIPPAVWGLLLFLSLIRLQFQWLIITTVAIVLSIANIIGYVKCSRDARQRIENMMKGSRAAQAIGLTALSNAFGSVFQTQSSQAKPQESATV